ncbi:ThiF family adenylyltransferase [Stenotrophomonas sp.]|uniref:ThiF family adenylyltransferase n=1 Tax=Stenotrophomonas sp. TaxID=69392 RepID=UPI00331471AD
MAQSRQESLGRVLRSLHQRGFVQLPSRGGVRQFDGVLNCNRGDVRIRLSIEDWDFTRYPVIEILEVPEGAPRLIPHISASGWFCYLADGGVVLDRYAPEGAVAQCLQIATDELNRLLGDPRYREGELQTEFGASWSIGQQPEPLPATLGTVERASVVADAYLMGDEHSKWLLISSDVEEPERLARVMSLPPPRRVQECWVLRSHALPGVGQNGVPTTIGELFSWLKSWDVGLHREFQQRLGREHFKKPGDVMVVIHCPAGWFGFYFELDKTLVLGFGRRPLDLRQQLHTRRRDMRLTRISLSEISPEFIHGRNLSFPSLKDKRIVLIGCGAIGGYLAEGLVRLGAGTGTGELTLVDPDVLAPGNLGRHALGMNALKQPKVSALASRLDLEFPHARVTPRNRSTRLPADLVGDLVINATGEEALSEAINFHRLELPEYRRPPTLHVWVTGEGACVQGLWVDEQKYACFRCLRRNDTKRSKRFDLGLGDDGLRVLGCTAFTPYAVSAPMGAAALALDMVAAWMSGDVSPRFRTRAVEGAELRLPKNTDVRPLPGCPACRAI